jgi:hypothetical protein
MSREDPQELSQRPATPAPGEVMPEEEPRTTGTFLLMMVFLALIFGVWAVMYMTLLTR